jgi:hypothetical protein
LESGCRELPLMTASKQRNEQIRRSIHSEVRRHILDVGRQKGCKVRIARHLDTVLNSANDRKQALSFNSYLEILSITRPCEPLRT